MCDRLDAPGTSGATLGAPGTGGPVAAAMASLAATVPDDGEVVPVQVSTWALRPGVTVGR